MLDTGLYSLATVGQLEPHTESVCVYIRHSINKQQDHGTLKSASYLQPSQSVLQLPPQELLPSSTASTPTPSQNFQSGTTLTLRTPYRKAILCQCRPHTVTPARKSQPPGVSWRHIREDCQSTLAAPSTPLPAAPPASPGVVVQNRQWGEEPGGNVHAGAIFSSPLGFEWLGFIGCNGQGAAPADGPHRETREKVKITPPEILMARQ